MNCEADEFVGLSHNTRLWPNLWVFCLSVCGICVPDPVLAFNSYIYFKDPFGKVETRQTELARSGQVRSGQADWTRTPSPSRGGGNALAAPHTARRFASLAHGVTVVHTVTTPAATPLSHRPGRRPGRRPRRNIALACIEVYGPIFPGPGTGNRLARK